MITTLTCDSIANDRAALRAAALRIISQVLETPLRSRASGDRSDWLAPPPLRSFKRLEPLGFDLHGEDEGWFFRPEDCPPDLVWPLDVGIITDLAKSGDLVLSRHYTVTPREARGYAHRFGRLMLRCDHAQMMDGELASGAGLYAWLGGNWVDADKRTHWEGTIPTKSIMDPADRMRPRLATAVALRQRYEWAVSLALEDSPSVRFATDPSGVKDVFRIRDLPEGKDRREALLNWVSNHWRQNRHDPEIEIYVRKHLRGATAFSWQGMQCELLPSAFDLEQRDKFIAERMKMETRRSISR